MFSYKVTHFYLADLFSESYLCVCQTFVWISQVFPVACKSSKGCKSTIKKYHLHDKDHDQNLYMTSNMTNIMT